MRPATVLAAVLLLAPVGARGQEPSQPRAFTPEDWYRLTTVSSPAMSPHGGTVAFTVTTVREEDNARHSEVWVVPTSGGEPTRFTAPNTESSNPRWSHDGRYLFFTSRRPGGEGSTWTLRMDRPGGEAFQLEDYPTGSIPRSGEFAISTGPADDGDDNGNGDAGDGTDDPFRRMEAAARPPFGSVTEPVDPARFDGRHIVDFPFKSNGRGYIVNPREAPRYRPSQVFRQDFGEAERVQLTNTGYSHRDVNVSPDGRWIAFVADAELRPDSVVQMERDSVAVLPYDAERDERDRNDVDLFVIPVNGGEPRRVSDYQGSESRIAWSPDSRRIAFVGRPGRVKQSSLYVVDVNGGEPRDLLAGWQYEPGSIEWLSNDRLAVGAAIGGSNRLFEVVPGREPREVLGGRRRMSGFSFDDAHRRVAYVSTEIDRPTELYVADADGRNERRLTSFNDALNAEIAWSDAERFTYESVGGLEIEGWLMEPYGYREGRQYPLVLYIHGGPHSSYGEGWFDEFQNIAGAGMWVLFTNPRGSSGYGADFTYSTRGRWGAEDYEDLMRAVDVVAQRPDVDSLHMGVTGGSYGGFMTAWITTRTDRFEAAQTDRMISNWWSWYGSSDVQGLTEFEFFGKPWENPELYDELSPLRYVDNVTTPTLMVQSEEDFRTPMTDAEQWFIALKKQGVPVEFVRYPRSTHDLSRTGEPWLLVDRLGRLRQWFTHWLLEE